MLLLAAVVGVACFLYGYFDQDNCSWSKEVCDPDIGGQILMCPQCDKLCPFWRLNVTCESSKKLCIFDSFGTLVFAVFMGVWGKLLSLFSRFGDVGAILHKLLKSPTFRTMSWLRASFVDVIRFCCVKIYFKGCGFPSTPGFSFPYFSRFPGSHMAWLRWSLW
ncbi:hypothetical protein U0070_021421 [Myodes glareolus]|uniref:Uncharacterized protein n=1 Tax=Myodes glareolus TaxID=447135 RepID=A0AAW0I191_MYOGA